MKRVFVAVAAATAVLGVIAPPAGADTVAYLVNVHVRPGYNFPNAEAAIGYGRTICDRVAAKMNYAQLVDQVKADFRTSDYYQAPTSSTKRSTSCARRRSGSCGSRPPDTPTQQHHCRVLIPLPHGCAADGRSHACSSRD